MHNQNELHTEKEIERMLKQKVEIPELVVNRIEETLDQIRQDGACGRNQRQDRKEGKVTDFKEKSKGKRKQKRHLGAITVAAAVLICTSITAAAAVFFHWNNMVVEKFEIDEVQKEKLVEEGVAPQVNASVTDNGVTISTEQALMDSKYIYLLIKIEAPEDIILPDSIFFEKFELTLDGQRPDFSYGASVVDENTNDHISYWEIWVNNMIFAQDFHNKVLGIHFENLTKDVEKANSGTKFIDGKWDLEWNMVYEDSETVFELNKEVPEFGMTVKSITLSPISIEVLYDWEKKQIPVDAMNENGEAFIAYEYTEPPVVIAFRMKDGSRQELGISGPGITGYIDEKTEYRWSVGTGKAVAVSDVEAVIFSELGGEKEVEVALQ